MGRCYGVWIKQRQGHDIGILIRGLELHNHDNVSWIKGTIAWHNLINMINMIKVHHTSVTYCVDVHNSVST